MMLTVPFLGRQLKGLSLAGLVIASLTGCSGVYGVGGQGDTAAVQPSRIMDPIAAFAAEPTVNGQAQVFMADRNETVTLRLVRQYAAASGRECREVKVTQRAGDSQRLYCRAGAGWIEARPLISETVGR